MVKVDKPHYKYLPSLPHLRMKIVPDLYEQETVDSIEPMVCWSAVYSLTNWTVGINTSQTLSPRLVPM